MKRYIVVLSCVALAAGCAKKSKPDRQEDVQQSVTESGEDSGEESTEASAESDGSDQPTDAAESGGHRHQHQRGHRFDEPEKYAKRWNDPDRDAWQKPDEVIALMEIEKGMTVADLGTGTGYLVPFLSEAVGPEGEVWALDIEPTMVEFVAELAAEESLENVRAKKVAPDDPVVSGVDRFVTVNVWHHVGDRTEYAKKLAEALNAGGSVTIVDYAPDADLDHGPPRRMRLEPETVVSELEAGGLTAEVVEETLPRQYVVVGRKN